MKRYMLVSAILCVLPWSALAGVSNPSKILEPVTFTRGMGSPFTETIVFETAGCQATLKLSSNNVSSATVAINGKMIFTSSEFHRSEAHLERTLQLPQGQSTLEVTLRSEPGSSITIEIVQDFVRLPPEAMLARTAAALRAGDINLALQGFLQDEKTLRIFPTIDAAKRHQLADMLENGALASESDRSRSYRYTWAKESGTRTVEFTIAIDEEGKWVIVDW